METKLVQITCFPILPTPNYYASLFWKVPQTITNPTILRIKPIIVPVVVPHRCKPVQEQDFEGLPKEFYDDEWQARQREKNKELQRLRVEEEKEEEDKVEEYREIALLLKDCPAEDLCNAKKLVASFIRSAEEVEEKIEEAAVKGELNELVLMVIWSRLDIAKRDDEKDAIRSLDLLYRRVEMEILKSEATAAMRLLNDLLNLHGGYDDEGWLKACRKVMVNTFPCEEDPFSILLPAGFDMESLHGPVRPPVDADDVLLRVDFVREVDALLQEVREEQRKAVNTKDLDPETVAIRLKQQEKQRAIHQVEALLDLAINLKW
ncbi:unnamed protein product [Cuscuta epithymum]|uniref:Protein PALE CRESS, chloroplastic n=1 Tax=Cuscuta epithymum TaxID=186058 RepID=A0AAV0DZX0_9ASTE|nr:unnamed protein product [Cuscuta epithymum]